MIGKSRSLSTSTLIHGSYAQCAGTPKGSDVPIDWHVADAYELKDGKIVRAIFGYPNVAAALEAGLSE